MELKPTQKLRTSFVNSSITAFLEMELKPTQLQLAVWTVFGKMHFKGYLLIDETYVTDRSKL